MQVHQSYLSLCQFFLLPARLDDISRTLQWNNKLVIGFFIFYFLWILHGHRWFKMSSEGLRRITALLDRVVFFLFNLPFYLQILQLHGAGTSSHSPHVQVLVQKVLSVILIACHKVLGGLQEQSFFAVLCLSCYQVLILELFYFIY